MLKHVRWAVLFLFFLLASFSFVCATAHAQTVLHVNPTDPTCAGQSPCFTTIQAAINAAGSGHVIQIQAGTYAEQLSITGKNNFAGAAEVDRIIIEADPATNPGQVVLTGVPGTCTGNHAVRLQQSKFITIRGLTITGTGGQAISLLGGNNQNQDIHIELNRIFANGASSCNGGITVNRGNPGTLIVNNLIYANGRNGITFIDADGGPHYVINNTIYGNQWNGIDVARNHTITLANNIINSNGNASGTTGGRFGVRRESSTTPQPAGIKLLNNLVCGNAQGQISTQVLDATDSSNFTPVGNEGVGVGALLGCEVTANLFGNVNGADNQPNTADDDFSLKPNSLAIDVGMDPRTVGFNPSYNPIFEADFVIEGIRPADGNADRTPAFDAGAFEFPNAPPAANAGANQTVATGQLVTLNGTQSSDPEGAPLTYQWTVVSEPAGSAIALNGATTATPTFVPPVPGQYIFQLVVSDGQFFSAPSTVVITAVGTNQAPTANSTSASSDEDISVLVTLTASDVDSASLSFSIVDNPTNGTLGILSSPNCVASGAGANCSATVSYTPAANSNGADSFTFKANDGALDSNSATVALTIGAVNDAPMVSSVTVTTDEDSAVVVTINATDVDSASLSFTIGTNPTNGTLGVLSSPNCVASGSGANCTATVTYTPLADYNGADSFTFKASDGALDSNVAIVSITVLPVNDAPIASNGKAATGEDNGVLVTLSATDIDSGALTFSSVTAPSNGVLGAIGAPSCRAVPNETATPGVSCMATVTYTPVGNFNGTDSFAFKVNDGALDSNAATVFIIVNSVNDVAVAAEDFYSTDKDSALSLGAPGVLGNDNDLDSPAGNLTAVLLTAPTHAASFTLNADGSFAYTPNANFTGTDSFTYKTNDGANDSNEATVTIAVLQTNNSPVAANDLYHTEKDTALNAAVRGVIANDNDLDTPAANLSAALITGPTRALSFTLNPDGSFDYTPQANFIGNDSFTYKANDGTSDSNIAMVTIAVVAPNTFPVANNDTDATNEDAARSVPAPGVLGNDSIALLTTPTATLVSGPRRALSFALNADGSFNYTAQNDYHGSDTLTYRIFDGTNFSNVAMVNIAVVAVNDLPVAQPQSVSTNQNTPVIITLTASDIDSTTLSFNIATPPANGSLGNIGTPNCTVQGQGTTCTATVTYTPAGNYFGPDSLIFTASDAVGTSATATVSINVILVNLPPTANAGGPYSGNVGVAVQFNGSGSDPNGNPITFSWTFGDGGTGSGPNPTYTYAATGTYTVTLTVTDSFGASAISQTTATISAALVLNSIGNKIVNLGETLTFTVSATSGMGSPVSLFVAPLPLMTNATFNASTGVFTFRPSVTQVGSYQLTFSATAGTNAAAETITISVPNPPPGGTTSVSGKVANLQNVPLSNVQVTVRSSGHTGFTDANGIFTISGVPSGTQQLIVNGRQANLGVFAIIAVAVELIDGVLNDLNSAISLPDVDVEAEVQVSPTFNTVVTNPNLPGVEVEIIGGSATNADGTPFTGKLSVNPVPDYGRPESRPEELRPGFAVTIQPAGIRFNPPARITFPNADSMTVGNELNLWSLSPDTGKFNIVGTMGISADGQSVITVTGGVSASAWHFPMAPSPQPSEDDGEEYNEECEYEAGSTCNLKEGGVFTMHSTPSYRSLGRSRSVSLIYSSVTADPNPIVSSNATLPVRAAVPSTFSTRMLIGGVQQGGEIFTNASSLPEDSDSTTRLAHKFNAGNLPTGRYPYEKTVFSNYMNSSIGGISRGNIIVVNRKTSALGTGWGISDLQQLHPQSDGGILLTTGNGRAQFFSGGPNTFTSPARDFSTLIKNPDGSYTRTFKDRTKFNFNAQGYQTSVVDRNLNTTSHVYDAANRLVTITDPAGLVTTFTYGTNNKLERITDPAGRQTQFQHDSVGNLIRITNPDGTFMTYGYDGAGRLVQANDERNNVTTYSYDHANRFSQSVRPGGGVRNLFSGRLAGLPNIGLGAGIPTNPAPIVQSKDVKAILTDERGNSTEYTLNTKGQVTSRKDPLGQITSTQYDANGNPTRITRPNGAVTKTTYDTKGNLLTTIDPVGATTIFTYEAAFNQVKTIRDPKGKTTTINYDANGNPIEIIDALNNRTQLIYDSRGLLTSVTSAFGTSVQTTTSFTYDARGNLLTTTNPKGDVTTLAYDSAGNVSTSTDAENRISQFTYDPRNRLVTVLDADLKTTQYGYDPKGNLTQVRDAKNQITTFDYDSRDRPSSATNPLGLTETFAYDANGNLTGTTNRNGQTIAFNYDALNRLTSKTRPPTSTETGNQATTYSYDSVGNLTNVTNPTIGVLNQYDAANRLVSSTSTPESALASSVLQINSDTTIAASNFQFEGKSLQVNGRILTVDGSHTFANIFLFNGAVLRHSPTTGSALGKLDITVTGTIQIDLTSRIDVTGLGFLAAGRSGNPFPNNGMTLGFQQGSGDLSGGSYGGLGSSGGSSVANPLHGEFRNPNDAGSGGGAVGVPGGNGGGLIRIVAQSLALNGSIRANGGLVDVGGSASGGSGGGIRIDVNSISGTGSISANGSNGGGTVGGGGGGGRVAIYYQNGAGFNFANVLATGATGPGVPGSGPGSVYVQGPSRENGELIIDNNNILDSGPLISTIQTAPTGDIILTHLRVRRGARSGVSRPLILSGTLEVNTNSGFLTTQPINASTVTLVSNSFLAHFTPAPPVVNRLELTSNSISIDATSRMDVTGRGFPGGLRFGNPTSNGLTLVFQQGSGPLSGGSYGGLGGSGGNSVANPVYGDFRNPNDPGSGGGTVGVPAGSGGGVIRVIAQSLTLNGVIRANGGQPDAGSSASGGSGGAIRLDIGNISGTGSVSANGAIGLGTVGGGGSGGRVAIYYQNVSGFNLGNVTAFGSTGPSSTNAGAGTIYLQGPARESGELIVDNNNVSTPSLSTPVLGASTSTLTMTNLRIRRGARAKLDSTLNLTGTLEITGGEFAAGNRVIADTTSLITNAVLTHLATTGTTTFKVDLHTDSLTIDSSSRVDVTGFGFLAAGRSGNLFSNNGMTLGFQQGSGAVSGGSYGGLGGGSDPNPVYGNLQNPNESGSGGGAVGVPGGNGGGLIRIAATTFTLNGIVRANAGATEVGGSASGGSGGGIRIDAGTISGTGSLVANGTQGTQVGGGGGGGRIAIYYQTNGGFNLSNVSVLGGAGSGGIPNGQIGTVQILQQIATLTPAFSEEPVMTAQASMGREGWPDSRVASFIEHANASLNGTSTVSGIAATQTVGAETDLQQGKVFSPDFLVVAQNSASRDHSNLYLAMVAEGKLKPFATTAVVSPGADVSEIVDSGSDNPKSGELAPDDLDPIYTYDLNGNRTSMIDPTGLTIYAYDALNRLTSITNNQGRVTSFTYDALGRRTSMTHANGAVTNYTYDAASQLLTLGHQLGATTINSFAYTYDKVGNRKSKTSRDGLHDYTYDTLNRLAQATNPLPTNPLETFNFDPVGNRTNSNQNGSSTFNQANQLLEDASFTYQYDNNGNQTRKTANVGGTVTQYEYDATNKLVRVLSPTNTVNYKYDGLGRRVEKEVITGTTVVTKYVYDKEDILLELNGANAIVARYTHGPGIDEPLIMEKNSESFYYHADGLGSITEITNQSGTVAQRYAYSSFGKIESQLDANFVQAYTYTSREFDSETGLYYYRARYYESSTGRFISEDPIGFVAGPNFYTYVSNNPINRIDPSGLFLDTVVDIGFILYDIYKLVTSNSCSLNENLAALGLDIIGAIVPGVTGLGAASRVARNADDIYVIGRRLDTAVAKDWPGHNTLAIPDWTLKKNDEWVQGIINKEASVYLGSPTTKDHLWDALTNQPTVFAREIQQLESAAYKRIGDYLIPPRW